MQPHASDPDSTVSDCIPDAAVFPNCIQKHNGGLSWELRMVFNHNYMSLREGCIETEQSIVR